MLFGSGFAMWTRALVLTATSVCLTAVAVSPALAADTVLYSFGGPPDVYKPDYGLVFGPNGYLYGTSQNGGTGPGIGNGTIYELVPATRRRPWAERVIYNFKGRQKGELPSGPLVFDGAGNAYGTTITGGAMHDCGNAGCGTVFMLSPPPGGKGHWTYTVIHRFNSAAGSSPVGALTLDSEGNLYGATLFGGVDDFCTGDLGGCGVIYRLSLPATGTLWDFKVLHKFQHETGAVPNGGLIFDSGETALYGTTEAGGTSSPDDGVVFKLAKPKPGHVNWAYSVLYNFLGLSQGDGRQPQSGLTFDANGDLVGTTQLGGDSNCNSVAGCGIIFKLSPSGPNWIKSTVHVFTGGLDGRNPFSGLTRDGQGNLYGTTSAGGSFSCGAGCGTVYRLAPNGSSFDYSILYGFGTFGVHDGTVPHQATLLWDGAHTLYGTTTSGGSQPEPDGTAYSLPLP